MANEKLSQLPSGASTLTVADLLYLAQSGASVSITIGDIPAAFALASAASPAAGTFTAITANGAVEFLNDLVLNGFNRVFSEGELDLVTTAGQIVRIFSSGGGGGCPLEIVNCTSLGTTTGASRIGSPGGVMSVSNDGESAALQLDRIVGKGAFSLTGQTVPSNQNLAITIGITNSVVGDAVVDTYDNALPVSSAGAVGRPSITVSNGVVTLNFYNSDPVSAQTLSGNVYLSVTR